MAVSACAGGADLPQRAVPVTAAEFVTLYRDLCFGTFPDQGRMRAAAEARGFVLDPTPLPGNINAPGGLEARVNEALELSLRHGPVPIVGGRPGIGGVVLIQVCELEGHVSDPENLDAGAIRAAFASDIAFAGDGANPYLLEGAFLADGDRARASFQAPHRVEVESRFSASDICGGAETCSAWRTAQFGLALSLGPPVE